MNVTWLIEAGVYGDEALPLLKEIRRQGMAAEVIPHQALRRGSTPSVGGRPLAADACVIGYGTYPFAQLNSFSGSWLYACDLSAVVSEVSALARRCVPTC